MYELLTGFTCLIPFCSHLIGTLIYKKFTEVQSPTLFYERELNQRFYEPLLQEEIVQT